MLRTFTGFCPRSTLFLYCQYISHHISDIIPNKLAFLSYNYTSCWYHLSHLGVYFWKRVFSHIFTSMTANHRNVRKYFLVPSSDTRITSGWYLIAFFYQKTHYFNRFCSALVPTIFLSYYLFWNKKDGRKTVKYIGDYQQV